MPWRVNGKLDGRELIPEQPHEWRPHLTALHQGKQGYCFKAIFLSPSCLPVVLIMLLSPLQTLEQPSEHPHVDFRVLSQVWEWGCLPPHPIHPIPLAALGGHLTAQGELLME